MQVQGNKTAKRKVEQENKLKAHESEGKNHQVTLQTNRKIKQREKE